MVATSAPAVVRPGPAATSAAPVGRGRLAARYQASAEGATVTGRPRKGGNSGQGTQASLLCGTMTTSRSPTKSLIGSQIPAASTSALRRTDASTLGRNRGGSAKAD